jgi:hypothetical protein
MKGLLLGSDEAVFKALVRIFNLFPISYDMAIGIVDGGQLAGGIILHWWNGHNIYLDYYGPKTLTPGLASSLAQLILDRFDVQRVTFQVKRKDRISKGLVKLGCVHEGNLKWFYGRNPYNKAAVQLVMLRPQIEKLAKRRVKTLESVDG